MALTGSLADEGHKLLHGYEMCVDAVNAKGGIKVGNETRKLDLVQYDYQSDTNTAVQMIQRLVTVDNVDFLMSPYNSGATKVAAVAAERYDTPMIATAAATPSVFDQHFKNLFGVLFPNADITDAEVAFYKDNVPGLKTVAVLAMNSLFPKAIAAQLKDTTQKAGMETVYDGLYSPGTLDFSNVLTDLKNKNADWIYATGFIQDLALLRRQMAGLGVTAKVVTMNAAAAYPEFQRNLGALANNVTSSAWWHPSVTYSDNFLFGGAAQYATDFDEEIYRRADLSRGRRHRRLRGLCGIDRGRRHDQARRRQECHVHQEVRYFLWAAQIQRRRPERRFSPGDPADPRRKIQSAGAGSGQDRHADSWRAIISAGCDAKTR